MSVALVSDLHLGAQTPRTNSAFVAFLSTLDQRQPAVDALWILGDLFEIWVGDDTLDDPSERGWLDPVLTALRDCSRRRSLWLMVGNRDFLLGARFADSAGIKLCDEPHRVNLGGVDTVLLHGDTLCVADVEYQQFRQQVRSPLWREQFLGRSYPERRAVGAQLRDASQAAAAKKSIAIMDADADLANEVLRQQGARRLIHGHTHRPNRHLHPHGERWVLPDWDDDRIQDSCAPAPARGLLIQESGTVEPI